MKEKVSHYQAAFLNCWNPSKAPSVLKVTKPDNNIRGSGVITADPCLLWSEVFFLEPKIQQIKRNLEEEGEEEEEEQ